MAKFSTTVATTALLTCLASPALALRQQVTSGGSASSATATADGSATPGKVPLPPLPPLEPIERPAPSAAALQTLEDRLSQLLATKVAGPVDPKADLRFLTTELTPETVAADKKSYTGQFLASHLDGKAAAAAKKAK